VRYSLDEVSSDRLLGWAFAPDQEVSVRVVVAGRAVGEATMGEYRIDVARSLGVPDAARSGFEFRFGPDDFTHVGEAQADVVLVLTAGADTVETEPVAVPVLAADTDAAPPTGPAPLPPGIVALLRRFRPATYDRPWDDELAERAVTDLRVLLRRGPRGVPALHSHLALLGQLWLRAAFVERYFPRENSAAEPGAKDRSAVQNSAVEVYAVAAHLATVAAHGVDGPLLEFGCFKGFSTAILSDACHQLGRTLHVFDSFAGLPPSSSAYYRAGEFAGTRAEVEANVGGYGRSAAVVYHEGFFADTVPEASLPKAAQLWLDVDLESSAWDAMTVLPGLDRRGVVFSHECPPEAFAGDRIVSERSPETVIPPILDAFADLGRPVAGRHVHGHTGAFWDAEVGIPVLPTSALLRLRDLALEL
jgi:O-methyltransferase